MSQEAGVWLKSHLGRGVSGMSLYQHGEVGRLKGTENTQMLCEDLTLVVKSRASS